MAKQHKTIFGTTEKSNFILNMNPAVLQKWTGAMLVLCVVIPQIGNLFITGLNASSSFLGAFLYLTGFSCVLFFIITVLKGEQSIVKNKIYFVVFFMAAWAFASYYSVVIRVGKDETLLNPSDFISTAMGGEQGRYEGLLALFAYFGIFLLATTVKKEKTVQLLMDVIVGAGIIQAVIAVFQHIPGLNFLTAYADLPTIALKNVMLSSGLSDSPIMYGSFLTLVTGIALTGAVFDENILRARIYGAAAALFWLTGLFTSSVVPIIGICCVFAAVTIAAFKKEVVKFGEGFFKTSMSRYAVLMIVMAVIFTLVFIFQGIYIRDKAIAYYDAFYRLYIVTGYSPVDERSLYEIGFSRSLDFIKQYPLFGTGPDCFAQFQLIKEETSLMAIDKSYNEYLYIAATRGIASLAAYLAFAAYVVKKGGEGMKSFFAGGDKWYRAALLAAVTAYLVQGFFSASTVTVAPLFWLMCGICCAGYGKQKTDLSVQK